MVPRKEILQKAWQDDSEVSLRTSTGKRPTHEATVGCCSAHWPTGRSIAPNGTSTRGESCQRWLGDGGAAPPPPLPLPTIRSISPASMKAVSAPFTLIVNGSSLASCTSAQGNGNMRSATFLNRYARKNVLVLKFISPFSFFEASYYIEESSFRSSPWARWSRPTSVSRLA